MTLIPIRKLADPRILMKFLKNQMTMELFPLYFKNFDKISGGQLQYVNYVSNEIEVWDRRTDGQHGDIEALADARRALKNDSLFQKIDSNLTTDFNHSQPATVCTVLNKHFTRNGNYAFFSSLVNFFLYSLVKNMIF